MKDNIQDHVFAYFKKNKEKQIRIKDVRVPYKYTQISSSCRQMVGLGRLVNMGNGFYMYNQPKFTKVERATSFVFKGVTWDINRTSPNSIRLKACINKFFKSFEISQSSGDFPSIGYSRVNGSKITYTEMSQVWHAFSKKHVI